jgi:iron-regulated transporter 1
LTSTSQLYLYVALYNPRLYFLLSIASVLEMASNPHGDEDNAPSERDPLLKQSGDEDEQGQEAEHSVPKGIARRLYVSHFLSTWNSRVFEFGAVLYLAIVYLGTLLPMSVYAFARGLSAIIFAPAIGQYIDSGNRLQVVRLSISTQFLLLTWFISANSVPLVVQRLVVAASCVIFYLLTIRVPLGHDGKTGILVLLAFLACIEKLCSIMNLVSVEKDWV